MIKAAATVNGQVLLALALTRSDTAKLHTGACYSIDIMTPDGKAGVLMLTAAETNEDAERLVREQLTEACKVAGVRLEIVP